MRRLAIFLYFLVIVTICFRLGEWMAFLWVMGAFLVLYHKAEELDDEGSKII